MPKEFTLFTDEEFELLVRRVAARIQGNRISNIIPHDIAEWLRGAIFDRGMRYQFIVPLAGANAMVAVFNVDLDGSINIELADQTGSPFWKGTLREMQDDRQKES